jgi:uncharacterized RDD family membrane protein YckC
MEQQTETNMLLDIEQDLYLERASVGARFANFLIDEIFYYVLLIGIIALILTNQDPGNSFLEREDPGALFFQYLALFAFIVIFFTIQEGAFKGKTLGKLITGTRAVKIDGGQLTWKDALMRSLCRLVPFEAFSAFGGCPWHDRWTDTIVTRDR